MLSFPGSIHGFSGLPVIFMPMLMQWKGRKFGYIIACTCVIVGWLLSLTANNAATILASESFHGLCTNSLLPVSILSLTEMLSPDYRFIAMQIIGLSLTLGCAVAGILGKFLYYKSVSIIMVVPAAIGLIIAFFWPESPPWLAWKGNFDECKKQFEWLRGKDDVSSKELSELIVAQTENRKREKTVRITAKVLWNKVTNRDFYVPTFHILLLLNMMYWSGGDFVIIYFLKLAEKSTQNENAMFYGSVIMYMTLFSGSIITNITVRKFRNKTVLLTSTIGVSICLLSIIIITYLQTTGKLSKESTLCIYFLVIYVACFSLGLNAVVFYIAAELMPVKHRSISGALYIVFNCGLYASNLKISPYLIKYIDIWATFLIFLTNAIICTFLVWKFVPETKGKTLVEIEYFYAHEYFLNKNKIEEIYSELLPMNTFDLRQLKKV